MKFSEHKAIKNEGGTWNILDVPVFELGEHKGFNYDTEWANEVLANFSFMKEKKRLPRIIIGHTAEGVEKKAFGFWDNLRLVGNQFITDLINIPGKIFNEIKDMNWPGRSVEVNPEKKKFTALALLGGSEPYFESLEPLEIVFEADGGGEWIDFGEITAELEKRDKRERMESAWWIGRDMIDEVLRLKILDDNEKRVKAEALLAELIEIMQTEGTNYINKSLEAQDMGKTFTEDEHAAILKAAKEGFSSEFSAQFKEKHGVTPEEALAEMRAHKVQLEKFAEKMRVEKITGFCEGLKKAGLAPALADAYAKIRPHLGDVEVAKFDEGGENVSAGEFMDKLFETFLGYAKEGKAVIVFGDVAGKTVQGVTAPENTEAEKRKYYQENREKLEKMGITEDDYVKFGE